MLKIKIKGKKVKDSLKIRAGLSNKALAKVKDKIIRKKIMNHRL